MQCGRKIFDRPVNLRPTCGDKVNGEDSTTPEALESSCATRRDHHTPKTPAAVACMIAPMTEGADDLDLVRRMASGDRTAMRVLYGRHQLKVYRFIVSILRD